MTKKYVLSIDQKLNDVEKDELKANLTELRVNITSSFTEFGVLSVELPNDSILPQLKKTKGILAVEDDTAMNLF